MTRHIDTNIKQRFRSKIQAILEGHSSFTLSYYKDNIFDSSKATFIKQQLESSLKNNSPGLFFYHLVNTIDSVIQLLVFVYEGYKPIIIPDKWSDSQIEKLLKAYPTIPVFDGLHFKHLNKDCQPLVNDDPQFMFGLCTSGSTGFPKIICASYSGIVASLEAINEAQSLDLVKNTVVLLPLYYSYALINQLFWGIYYEKSVILTDGLQNLNKFLALIKDTPIEMTCMVGQQIRLLDKLQICNDRYAIPSTKVINFAGAPFPYTYFESIKALFPKATIMNNYGCTEALPRLTVVPVTQNQPTTCTGLAIRSITLKINNPNADNVGKICFKGTSASMGLLNASGKVRPHSTSEWIESGDSGYIDDNGHLHVLGRFDDLVNIGGERISLQTIVNHLKENISVEEACVFMRDLSDKEPEVVAVIKVNDHEEEPNFKRFLSKNINKLFWPKQIYQIDEFPLNDNQKIDLVKVKKDIEKDTLKSVFKYVGL